MKRISNQNYISNITRQVLMVIWICLYVSCSGGGGAVPDTGSWYKASYSGKDYFFRIDSIDGKDYSGSIYGVSEWPVADRHTITGRRISRSISISVDGGKRVVFSRKHLSELNIGRYMPPEFDPGSFNQNLYRSSAYEVKVQHDILYGSASGYYSSLPGYEEKHSKLISDGLLNTLTSKETKLEMDIYTPDGKSGSSPLVMFIHGGAFYAGDKAEPAYVDLCSWFASLGYVTASINYRLGFKPSNTAIQRAGYRAVQDANAAMRYLVHNAREYGIDTTRIYVAGSSAGAITALNMEFMNDGNCPDCVRGGLLREDLGDICHSGNELTDRYDIRAIASLWGGVNDLNMLAEGDADIILFHGTDDDIIPYDVGYPFSVLWEGVSSLMFERMYGSRAIDREGGRYGIRTVLRSFPGEGHALNVDNGTLNDNHYIIRGDIQKFLFEEMTSGSPVINTVTEGLYEVSGESLNAVQWQADGGFILEGDNATSVRVLWMSDSPFRTLHACGEQLDGIGFETSAEIR